MTAPSFTFTETLTLVRQAGRDRFGDPTGSETDVDITGCVVWPAASVEQTGVQDTVTADLTVVMPAGTDVRPTDQVRRNGLLYDVQGEPQMFTSPFTATSPGVVVNLKRSTG